MRISGPLNVTGALRRCAEYRQQTNGSGKHIRACLRKEKSKMKMVDCAVIGKEGRVYILGGILSLTQEEFKSLTVEYAASQSDNCMEEEQVRAFCEYCGQPIEDGKCVKCEPSDDA